jgi:cytochrome c-type biogenesis protein CcmH
VLEFLLAALTTATVGALLIPLLKSRVAATDRLDNDLAVYRDQLAEVERERADGTLPAADAEAARLEIERRILAAADRDALGAPHASGAVTHRLLPTALCLLIPLFALGLYLSIGHPGLPSAPFKPGNALPEAPAARVAEVIAGARAQLAKNPDDPQALSALGEALTVEAGGTVTPAALEALNKAAVRNPDDPRTLFYLGLHEAQSGDSAAALSRWQALEARSPTDAPWLPTLRAEIQRVAKAAGVSVPSAPAPAPPGSSGPTQEQMQAMQNLSPAERQQAIRGMVEGLDAKLRDNPSDRDGWLRLANARRVLGEADKAAEAYAKADQLAPLDARQLADWAEAHVRQVPPGGAVPPAAVAVLQRLEKAEPNNGLALFYLGAADFAAGHKQEAARRWKALLALLPSDAPIRGMLEQKIKEAE